MPHQAEILAVGTELLLGNITNTNAQFLSELLASAGIDVLYHTAVGDNPQRLRAAVLLPGVPHECRYLAEHALLPWLQGCSGGVIRSHDLRVFGLTEPRVQELLGDLMDRAENPSLAPYAKPGEVMLRLTAKGESPQDCQERMAPLFWDVRSRLGDCLYGVDVSSLEEVVITRLRQKGLTLSAAESCTGGLIAKRLTDVPGASAAFLGGVVSYTNAVKAGVLGVPRDLLEQYGPVSEPVARAMAEGVRRLTGSDLSVSVTGLAGPDGDDRGNPVGTVYLGLSLPGETLVRRLALGGDRPRIRLLAASSALDIIRRHLCDLPIEQE